MEFLKGTKDLARNPLGIIALFISLIYGFASLLLNSAAESLTVPERWPLILFIVFFPVLVLVAFYKLVTKHHGKLYAPGDFKDDKSFLRTLSQEEQEERLEKELAESLVSDAAPSDSLDSKKCVDGSNSPDSDPVNERAISHKAFLEELKTVEKAAIKLIANELNVEPEFNVGISNTDAKFDAFLQVPSGKFTFLEVKALRSYRASVMLLDRILYQALVADRFFESNFKLILAVVYYFEEEELESIKRAWGRKIAKCPADIEIRYIHRSEVKNA